MKPGDLLQAWDTTRRRPEVWGVAFAEDPQGLVRVCGAALAAPQEPSVVVAALLADGEFELAELLLLDDRFVESVGPAALTALEAEVVRVRSATLREVEADLEFLLARMGVLGVRIDAAAIRGAAYRRRAEARQALADVERTVAQAEDARQRAFAARLDATPRTPEMTENAFEGWRASVRCTLAASEYDAAEAALAQGPTADLSPAIDVPAPIRWSYDGQTVAELLAWCRGERPSPPEFARFIADTEDPAAQSFLAAAQHWVVDPAGAADALLRAFAAVMGCELVVEERPAGGRKHSLDDLSAPGLHAFGRGRWPDGIPVEVDASATFLVHASGGALRLPLRTVIATLHDRRRRRWRLLAELGRQVPLTQAFVPFIADESVRWARHDLDITAAPDKPLLLVAAPGMGATTLLRELAAPIAGAAVIDAPFEPNLPEAPAIFLDRVDRLSEAELRTLVREILWVRTIRRPAPMIVLSGRPELRAKLGPIPADMFVTWVLAQRSLSALREQARTTLEWVGIYATRPGIYDRMAWLASGNPTLLLLLCRSVTQLLAEGGGVQRRLDDDLVAAAWRTSELRHAARILLWDPVLAYDGMPEVIQAITQVDVPGRSLRRDDVAWLLGGRDNAWIEARMQLLADYGLMRHDSSGEYLWLGGLAQLVSHWTNM
jgi:hypothetical protein